jgi:hypothetical protein
MITWRARAYKPRESTPQPHTGHHWASREHAGALGYWHVVSVYPVIYYPRAKECTA